MVIFERKPCRPISEMLMPSIIILPLDASKIRNNARVKVDFPEPVRPTIPIYKIKNNIYTRRHNPPWFYCCQSLCVFFISAKFASFVYFSITCQNSYQTLLRKAIHISRILQCFCKAIDFIPIVQITCKTNREKQETR